MKRAGRWLSFWLPPAAWAAAIFALSSISLPPQNPMLPYGDKLIHGLVFGLLALWLLRALIGERGLSPWTYIAKALRERRCGNPAPPLPAAANA